MDRVERYVIKIYIRSGLRQEPEPLLASGLCFPDYFSWQSDLVWMRSNWGECFSTRRVLTRDCIALQVEPGWVRLWWCVPGGSWLLVDGLAGCKPYLPINHHNFYLYWCLTAYAHQGRKITGICHGIQTLFQLPNLTRLPPFFEVVLNRSSKQTSTK